VEYLTLPDGNELEIPLESNEDDNYPVVLVVTGTTRFTRQTADYWIEIEPR
jgi:hypothetical protein